MTDRLTYFDVRREGIRIPLRSLSAPPAGKLDAARHALWLQARRNAIAAMQHARDALSEPQISASDRKAAIWALDNALRLAGE